MDYPSRDEMEARIESAETRLDGRVLVFQASVDGYIARMDERAARSEERFTRIEAALVDLQAQVRGLKTTVVVTAVSATIAIVLGIAGFNAALVSNLLAAFESGKSQAAAQAELHRQAQETAALLREINHRLAPPTSP